MAQWHFNSEGGRAFLLQRAGIVDFGYAIHPSGVVGASQIYAALMAGRLQLLARDTGRRLESIGSLFSAREAKRRRSVSTLLQVGAAIRIGPMRSSIFCSRSGAIDRGSGATPARRRSASSVVAQAFSAVKPTGCCDCNY